MNSIFLFLYIIVLYFDIIHTENCQNIKPKSRNDCFIVSSPNEYCCFVSNSQTCTLVKKKN